MSERYNQSPVTNSQTRFTGASFGEVERSRMLSVCEHLTTFNAGDIVPIMYEEVLPSETLSLKVSSVIRQTTLLTPTMGRMEYEIHAFFVPNRVVNKSTQAVFGENYNGSWTSAEVVYAPLLRSDVSDNIGISVPVGSVADYYGYPTQTRIPAPILKQCNDLKFRGYIEIYNRYFRDENYQAPIAYSKLNVYEGFFERGLSPVPSSVNFNGSGTTPTFNYSTPADGQYAAGAIKHALCEGQWSSTGGSTSVENRALVSVFNALGRPLKANKKHDYFTSVLPSPQKGPSVFVPVDVPSLPVGATSSRHAASVSGIHFVGSSGVPSGGSAYFVGSSSSGYMMNGTNSVPPSNTTVLFPDNLFAMPTDSVTVSLSDIRQAAAIQQVYETLARGGSRYVEYIRSFFSLEVENPFEDIPTHLGFIRRPLELYQTAQTSSSVEGSTPQGNLAAFGYSTSDGELFTKTFNEHGYVHIFVVVRQNNIYSSYMARDNFRRSMLDFYQPPLANLSEQPVYLREINPFASNGNNAVFGYQEAWAEYRMDPDRVSGYMRPGLADSLAIWNYADDFDSSLAVADGNWLKSNAQSVLDRTLAVTSEVSHQFKGQFVFEIDKELPMPTYSVPGMDII